jgi:carbon storage regulator
MRESEPVSGAAYGLGSTEGSPRRKPLGIDAKGSRMLVLSRKKNESIVINNDITIVVVEIRGDKVRLGVEAPKEVPVHRREVYDAIRRNDGAAEDNASKKDAAGSSNVDDA